MSKIPVAGFEPNGDSTWIREFKGFLFSLESAGDGEWWLTMVCDDIAPRMEFSGPKAACRAMYIRLHEMIRADELRAPGRKRHD